MPRDSLWKKDHCAPDLVDVHLITLKPELLWQSHCLTLYTGSVNKTIIDFKVQDVEECVSFNAS
jgi:hypothetical protein